MSEISSTECRVLGKYPQVPDNAWSDVLTEEDREAYRRVHRALTKIADDTSERFSGRLKSVPTPGGFYEKSGVRNQRPKDLWCALINPDSADYVGMPQIFMIASSRGVELGFSPAIHTSQFSNASVRKNLRRAIPTLFKLFPDADGPLVAEIQASLLQKQTWSYRGKTRLEPGSQEFESLTDLIANLKQPDGIKRGAASVSRYILIDEIDDPSLSLAEEFSGAAEKFLPMMEYISRRYSHGVDLIAMNHTIAANGGSESADEIGAYEPESNAEGRQQTLRAITQRKGQGKFRLSLLEAYDGACAITSSHTLEAVEAAHIFPYVGDTTNHVTNGILLRSDIHTLFDLGLLKIGDDYSVIVSNQISEQSYRQLHGSKINLPTDISKQPSREALAWHRENVIYGER